MLNACDRTEPVRALSDERRPATRRGAHWLDVASQPLVNEYSRRLVAADDDRPRARANAARPARPAAVRQTPDCAAARPRLPPPRTTPPSPPSSFGRSTSLPLHTGSYHRVNNARLVQRAVNARAVNACSVNACSVNARSANARPVNARRRAAATRSTGLTLAVTLQARPSVSPHRIVAATRAT